MSQKWMLDTDVCIHILNRRHAHQHIIQRMHGLSYGQIIISAISHAELYFGIANSQRQKENLTALILFLERFEIAPFDHKASEHYGNVRYALQSTGQPIGPLDTLIAAHAISLDCCLVTHNVREFSRIEALSIEDWISESSS